MGINFTNDIMSLFEKIADDPEYQIDFDSPAGRRMLMMIEVFRTMMNTVHNNCEAKLLQQTTNQMLGEMSWNLPSWDHEMADEAQDAAMQYLRNHLLAKGL